MLDKFHAENNPCHPIVIQMIEIAIAIQKIK